MKNIVCICMAVAVFPLICPGSAWATNDLAVRAEAYCLIDRNSGQFLAGKNENEERPIASITKIMTALTAVEYIQNLDENTQVSRNADQTAEYTAGLKEGQVLSLREALKGALIKSYNDTAVVLAEYVAGDEDFFAYLMTCKAFALGAVHTRFCNASGLPDPDRPQSSTAYEVAVLARQVLMNPVTASLVSSREVQFCHPGYKEPLSIHNTNPLLTVYPGADGIKTGTADASGKCLAVSASRENQAFIAVVLHSSDRAGDGRKLLDYGFSARPQEIMTTAETIGNASTQEKKGISHPITLVPGKNVVVLQGNQQELEIQTRIQVQENMQAPVDAGQRVGQMQVWINHHYFSSVDVRSKQAVTAQKWVDHGIEWMMKRIYDQLILIW